MTRPARYKLPRYVQAFVDRETGLGYYYFRRRGSPRVRLPGLPWSPEFMAAYQRALEQSKRTVGKRGSIAETGAPGAKFSIPGPTHLCGDSPEDIEAHRRALERFLADPPDTITHLVHAYIGNDLDTFAAGHGLAPVTWTKRRRILRRGERNLPKAPHWLTLGPLSRLLKIAGSASRAAINGRRGNGTAGGGDE